MFAWLVLHEKILTADNLDKRGWDHGVVCPLCLNEAETTSHLLTQCLYSKNVLEKVCGWFSFAGTGSYGPSSDPNEPKTTRWLEEICRDMPKEDRRFLTGVILYSWWNIWKERNRRIFQGKEEEWEQVTFRAKEEINQYKLVTRTPLLVRTEQQQENGGVADMSSSTA